LPYQLSSKKPTVEQRHPPLCSFSSGKAYLWSLVGDELDKLQDSAVSPLHILDAACHSLITRNLFPTDSLYYGLDVSSSRLRSALSIKKPNDILYQADLTRPLSLDSNFDCVVSCNTMSHLPIHQQTFALTNLINACRFNGSLFVNFSLNAGVPPALNILLKNFKTVKPIYFESTLSSSDQKLGLINSINVFQKIHDNELKLPNDASLHYQVLFCSYNRISGLDDTGKAPRNSNSVLILSSLPQTSVQCFEDDTHAFNAILASCETPTFLFSEKLYTSAYGKKLRSKLPVNILELSMNISRDSLSNNVYIFGLEKQWTMNLSHDRISINQIRELDHVSVIFALVRFRAGSVCTPSLIIDDC